MIAGNFGNSTADVYILGQFRVYLKFRGRKYLNTFIVTNANDCPNILSHGAIFRMGILVPNYLEENMVNVRDMETGTSNVFQVLQDLRMQQYQGNSEPRTHRPGTTVMTTTTRQLKASETPKSHETASQKAGTATHTGSMSPIQTSFRTMPPPKPSAYGTIPTPELNTAYRRPASRIHQPHSHSQLQACCIHVHQQQSKTYRMEEPPALEEVKYPHRDRTSVSRSPSTEQEVLSQFSGFPEEIEHFTRDPYTTHLRSCIQSTGYAPKIHEVNTCIDCEHSHGHMNDHQVQNTPDSLGKQFLQGKEKITCTDMENTPNMDTNTYANMDTNHTAHRDRDARKEAHLLSGPSELRPFKAMTHQHTRKEAHLLSRPSELQPTEHPETQKLDSAHVQQTRQEYSRLTEINKAKFQDPFIYNDERNFIRHNSVSKISSNNVFMTTPNTSVSNSVFCRKKGRKRGKCRDSKTAEGPAPAPTAEGPVPAPAPAPAATLEKVHE